MAGNDRISPLILCSAIFFYEYVSFILLLRRHRALIHGNGAAVVWLRGIRF